MLASHENRQIVVTLLELQPMSCAATDRFRSSAVTIGDAHAPEIPSFERIDGAHDLGLLLLCDHASNALPTEYGDLGVRDAARAKHIAYDIGAATITRVMARILGVPALLTTYSRLLIDPNRGLDDPTLVMRLSDREIIPGNRSIDKRETDRRIALFHAPYHQAIEVELGRFDAIGVSPIIFCVHSFTPVMQGFVRPWHVGVLWDADGRLALPLIEALAREPGLVVGDNEPYDGAHEGATVDRHATLRGLANALIEVRQDLIDGDEDATRWGERLARLISPLMTLPDLRRAIEPVSRVANRDLIAQAAAAARQRAARTEPTA